MYYSTTLCCTPPPPCYSPFSIFPNFSSLITALYKQFVSHYKRKIIPRTNPMILMFYSKLTYTGYSNQLNIKSNSVPNVILLALVTIDSLTAGPNNLPLLTVRIGNSRAANRPAVPFSFSPCPLCFFFSKTPIQCATNHQVIFTSKQLKK